MTNAAQLIQQDSGRTSYFTPLPIIEAARATMGSIDLDPASCKGANYKRSGSLYGNYDHEGVHYYQVAGQYFTEEEDGLSRPWSANSLWLNHPFSREGNKLWIDKLVNEFSIGNVNQACCITYACTSEAWFQPLFQFPMCFLSPRTNYLNPDGSVATGVTKGSVVTYLGPRWHVFANEFESLGTIVLPYKFMYDKGWMDTHY